MKLVRFGAPGAEKPGVLDAKGLIRDLSGEIGDLAGDALGRASLDRLTAIDPETLPLVENLREFASRLPEDVDHMVAKIEADVP